MFCSSYARIRISTRICRAIQHRPPPSIGFSRTIPAPRISWPRPRHITFRTAAKKLFKESPFSVTLATVIIIFGAGCLLYTHYFYHHYIIGEFSPYPEPVAVKLRRALFYTNVDLQPTNAVKYYRQALEVADEMGLDPFSDEIIGVKIQLAFLMEKIERYEKAIEVLEIVLADCLKWIEALGGKEGNEAKRTRVLGKTVGISVKLGELYSSNQIDDLEAAEEKLMYSVTAVLKEKKRREKEGVKEGEGPWISDEEVGASLEALAELYQTRNLHYLAAPLLLQALSYLPPSHCHSVVLKGKTVNQLAISLVLQTPPLNPSVAPTSQAVLLDNAAQWARKAITLADSIKDPARRTPECDKGCAVAMVNLGEFARQAGDADEARRWLRQGKKLCRDIGYVEGMQDAEEKLRGMEGVD